MMEKFDSKEINGNFSENEKVLLKEDLFHEVINSKIVDTYEKELNNFGYNEEQISSFREKILSLNTNDREYLYSFPWELKQRMLPFSLEKINQNKDSIEDMIDRVVKASKDQHRRVAYHASNENIAPKKYKSTSGKMTEGWVIDGTERDHRDDDVTMAYYSFDYNNLYRTKNPKFIYIVSIQENEKAGHRRDGNNEWGRAPSLTVIEKIDLKEVDDTVEFIFKDRIKKAA